VSVDVSAAPAMDRDAWLRRRTYDGADFDPDELIAIKRSQGTRISVCLPARDVAETVGAIVEAVRGAWTGARPLVDEVVVIDSGSSDATARVAARAGASVVAADHVLPGLPARQGKGEALWKSLAVVRGDVVAWLDADVEPFDPDFVPGLVGPLLHRPDIAYVKGYYRRDLPGRPGDGGRVTEICARPLINLLHPELAGFAQPLAGEAAGRTELLRSLPFFTGYAVEIGLLIDLSERVGLAGLAQVDLGSRTHRNQSTAALGAMAHEITRAVLGEACGGGADTEAYVRPVRRGERLVLETATTPLTRRPPLDSVAPRAVARV
jgi:glucosyl-3-phosphoglycerate synthase